MNIVVVGGGKGQSALLRGLKNVEGINLKAIVTVADDGGSTGRLREEFNLPAMGDIRNVMLSLAESESLLSVIMNYRFDEESRSSLAGHNLGNLIFTALATASGNFMEVISQLSQVLNVKGEVIPASMDFITLCARMEDGTIVRGESNIPKYNNTIDHVYYDIEVKATNSAVDAIMDADVIVMGVGSIYTSILPNLIIPEITDAMKQTKAKKVYYCNAMSQPGETDGYTAEDHVNAILKHIDTSIDLVVVNSNPISDEVLEHYEGENSFPVLFRNHEHTYRVLHQNLLRFDNNRIRHDHDKVAIGFTEVLEALECPLVVK